MSSQHPKMEAWDQALQDAVETVDREMERRHGHTFSLRWNRPQAGETCNPQMDGLFNIGIQFTLGYGSDKGRGYLLDVQIASRENPGEALRHRWEDEAAELLRDELAERFPGRELYLERDGRQYKITGDFNLGAV